MSKDKDISTMFTKEENKKNGRLGYVLATREKMLSVRHSMERFYRKKVREDE